MKEKLTDFGYEKVAYEHKASKVREVFDSVTDKYDLMNDFMSFGLHKLWKREAIASCNLKPKQKVLDLASGTCDLAKKMSTVVGKKGEVIASDINLSMLSNGRDRLLNQGFLEPIKYVQANAEVLPFPSNYFDAVTISFGLRNVTDKGKALAEIERIIKPGGRLVILEFSKPTSKSFQSIYDFYSFKVIPKIGKIVANDSESYKYLVESIRMHPNQEDLKQLILDSGFDECNYKNLTSGVVAIHTAYKY